jgi:ribosomal-protein-alanine N-acetyltransferase
MQLKSKHVLFREILEDDIPQIHQLNILPEVDKYNTLGIPKNIKETQDLTISWITAQQQNPREKYVWLLQNKEGCFIGLLGLNKGKKNYLNAEIWYKLFPEFWNKGFATEVVKCVLNFCFFELKLHRITAGCATENIASIKVLEKAGLKKEAHHRKILPIRGQWIDNYEFAILEEDYFKSALE